MLREVRFLNMGYCLIDHSQLVSGDPVGHVVRIPIWAYLLRGDDALMLVDSGMPTGCIDNEGFFGEADPTELIVPQMRQEDMVDRVLLSQGVRLEDLDALISSHWHFDHAGGNNLFRGTRILVHPAEVQSARAETELPEWVDLSLPYEMIEDGAEPMPGVQILHTPGHTPGHLSLRLQPEGVRPIVLTIDAVYTRRNWDADIPGAMMDPVQGQASAHRLRDIARADGAAVFFGHDPDQAGESFWQTFAR